MRNRVVPLIESRAERPADETSIATSGEGAEHQTIELLAEQHDDTGWNRISLYQRGLNTEQLLT
jgi:hypothetical protein